MIMNINRIIFFSKDDLARFDMLARAEIILNEFDTQKIYTNINDIIELYHIKQYIDSGLYLDSWTFETREKYKRIVKDIWGLIYRFCALITDDNIETFLNEIKAESIRYVGSFWQLIEKCEIYKRLSNSTFTKLFEKIAWKEDILENFKIVSHFNSQLRELLMSYEKTAEILLSYYEKSDPAKKEKIFFPKSLSIEDKDAIVSRYIDSKDANLNYVNLAIIARDQNDFKLSTKTKLKAQRRHKEELTKLFQSDLCVSHTTRIGVCFSETQETPKLVSNNNNESVFSYSIPYIKQNLHPIILFKNFQWLFEYFDRQSRITLVRKRDDISFIDTCGIHSDAEYLCPYTFSLKNNLALMQIVAYEHILADQHISLDDTIKGVFNTFCTQNKITNLDIRFETSSDFLSKIRYIYPEMDSLLKRYKLYVEDGIIDMELLAMSSVPSRIEDIPSLVQKKYVYGVNSELDRIMFALFSDQSMLSYIKMHKGKYHSLVELIENEIVTFDLLEEYQKPQYETLISQHYLCVEDNIIHLANKDEISVLRDLYNNGVIAYWHMPTNLQSIIDKLATEGKIEFVSSLFSRDEADYFNYYLNNKFSNGKELRNKYAHGTHVANVSKIKKDYYRLLILMILILWKIIDDILLSFESAKDSSIAS